MNSALFTESKKIDHSSSYLRFRGGNYDENRIFVIKFIWKKGSNWPYFALFCLLLCTKIQIKYHVCVFQLCLVGTTRFPMKKIVFYRNSPRFAPFFRKNRISRLHCVISRVTFLSALINIRAAVVVRLSWNLDQTLILCISEKYQSVFENFDFFQNGGHFKFLQEADNLLLN